MTPGGYRGYLASRPVRGTSFPQAVQNLVVRDYATRKGLPYLLHVTEYAMPACYLMLTATLEELPKLGGIIFFSIFMLPPQAKQRARIYDRVLQAECTIHAALESLSLRSEQDIAGIEDLLEVAATLPRLPFAGRYDKDETSAQVRNADPFWAALEAAL